MRTRVVSRQEWLKACFAPIMFLRARQRGEEVDLQMIVPMNTHSPDSEGGAANDLLTSRGGAYGGSGNAAARGMADWLSLAAAPTFAFMALLTVLGGGPDMLCPAGHDASPLTGMVAMYLLMSAFHSAPWLKLVASRRSAARRR